MRPRLSTLASVTVVLTFVLILLGVYTAATGGGLTCQGRWPACGGGPFGFLPPNAASVPEWTHRLVAMVTGFAIFGTAAEAWVGDHERRTRAAAGLAALLLPLQVVFGAETIFSYGPTIQVIHHGTAQLIFAGVIATALWAADEPAGESSPGT
ncbi:MAG: COX15/CtaA family protein [Halobacteriaceae archaeon]